ncbi:MAG TPA: hypothetical protein ENL46_05315 [Candidatus Aminicenantes bacterium]|nr:hypothetical protein [Candidatus Aminicenantes bacterium]
MFKKFLLIVGILGLIALNFSIYWSVHLYYKGKDTANFDRKVSFLKRSQKLNPMNDKVYYELGKAYFDLGTRNFRNKELRDENLEKSIDSFIRSVRLNPGAYSSHFRLAQALSYMDYFKPVKINYYDQYKKAALLTTYDDDIYFEIGKIMLSRWEQLAEDEREYTLEMMKNVIDVKGSQGLMDVIQVWATYVEDYSVINELLPQKPESLRMYADYLGGRSLSLKERLEKLSKAESMEFELAKSLYKKGLNEARIYHMDNARQHLSSGLRLLDNIKYYQSLTGDKYIDEEQFLNTKKSTLLGLLRLQLQRTGELKEAEGHLKEYLEIEDEDTKIEELEKYMVERNLFEIKPGGSENILRFYFKFTFDFKQHRYREIIRERENVEDLLYTAALDSNKYLIKILQIIGDSYQGKDFVYDAGEFYQKALDLDPQNIGTLQRMRENYKRLNDLDGIKMVDEKISEIVMPDEMTFDEREIRKGETYRMVLLFTGESSEYIDMELAGDSIEPLVAVFFNGKVVDEQYAAGGRISGLELKTKQGQNTLEIKPINKNIKLVRISRQNNRDRTYMSKFYTGSN